MFSTRHLLAAWALLTVMSSCKTNKPNSLLQETGADVSSSGPMVADANGFQIQGQYRFLRGGTLQWWRIEESQWEDRIQRFKAMGFNTIDLYIPWNIIEVREGEFNFERPDLKRFMELTQKYSLYVYLRPGPYITNEMDGGGLPAWLMTRSTKKTQTLDGLVNFRTDDPDYLAYVKKYFHAINGFMKPYLITQQGNIILYSVENEYNWFQSFFNIDKYFRYLGGWERDRSQELHTRNYLQSLAQMVREDGIDVPITTCPGDGYVSGMDNAQGIIPMPNIYGSITQDHIAYKAVNDMHNPALFEGAYKDFPSGATETERTPIVMNKLLFGGMDAYFGFNIVGHSTPGYNNAVTMSNDTSKIFDVKLSNISSLFLRPIVGLFPGVIDYYGAITPSGLNREKFHSFRRFNMFYDSFEKVLAAQGLPHMTENGVGSQAQGIEISHPGIGSVRENSKAVYWFEADGTRFFHLVNETQADITLPPGSIKLKDRNIPKYGSMLVESDRYPGQVGKKPAESFGSHILVTQLRLNELVTLDYSTSQILSLQKHNDETWFLLYGKEGSEGELVLSASPALSIEGQSEGLTKVQDEAGHLSFQYRHQDLQSLSLMVAGTRLRIFIMPTALASRTWISDQRILFGVDYLAPGTNRIEQSALNSTLYVYPDVALQAEGLVKKDLKLGVASYSLAFTEATPDFSLALNKVSTREFSLGSSPSRQSWQGEPKVLEELGVLKGRATYETSFVLEANPQTDGQDYELFIEHASDFISLFVNGSYLTTLVPFGTPIQTDGNERYKVPGFKALLKQGNNTLRLATEIWGHGSFMFPRGTLFPSSSSLPSVGFDGVKGLWGKARVNKMNLTNWTLIQDENETTRTQALQSRTSNEVENSLPLALNKGQRSWVRITVPLSQLPDPKRWHAPVALELKGKNLRGTIFHKGEVVGRWISDSEWIQQGNWIKVTRDMWSNVSVDDFPIFPREGDSELDLQILLEDSSAPDQPAGLLSSLRLKDAAEEFGVRDGFEVLVGKPSHRLLLNL